MLKGKTIQYKGSTSGNKTLLNGIIVSEPVRGVPPQHGWYVLVLAPEGVLYEVATSRITEVDMEELEWKGVFSQ